MKYNIISINDDRIEYKQRIRDNVDFDEVYIPATDGYNTNLNKTMAKRGLWVPEGFNYTPGEIGVWCSMFDCWVWAQDNHEPLISFEDDALPKSRFRQKLEAMLSELPSGWDFLTLWIPENQLVDFVYDCTYDEFGAPTHVGPNKNSITSNYNIGSIRLAKVYNGYGNVAMLFSPKGAATAIELAQDLGMNNPIDCFIYCQAHTGRLNGYAPKPNYAKLVDYDWKATTTVHK